MTTNCTCSPPAPKSPDSQPQWEVWLLFLVVIPVALLRGFDTYELLQGRDSLTENGVFEGVPAKYRE